MKKLVHLLFLVPLAANALNLQDWVTFYLGNTMGKLVAYGNVALVALGALLIFKKRRNSMRTASSWIAFLIIHYSLSILASSLYDNPADFKYTLVNIIFYFGFLIYIASLKDFSFFHKYLNWIFFIGASFLIILWRLQLDLDYIESDLSWGLDRASGLYGDANNACLVSIVSFIFLKFTDLPKHRFTPILKLGMILIVSYSIFLTFSTTGYLAFVVVFVLCNYKFLTKKNIFISIFTMPVLYLLLINLTTLTSGLGLNERQQSKISNFENIFSFNFDKVDNSGRSLKIDNVIEKLYENPFSGHGFDFGLNNLTHNTYLNIWLESGIFGLLALLIVLGIYYKRTMLLDRKTMFFSLSILFTISLFMLSLQTVINQPYLMIVLTYLGFLIDKKLIKSKHEKLSEEVL